MSDPHAAVAPRRDRGRHRVAEPAGLPRPRRTTSRSGHAVHVDVLVTRVFRRGFRPPPDFPVPHPIVCRPSAIVTTSGFGLRAGPHVSWYPISDILLVTPGEQAVGSARIDFLSGARAQLRVEQQWLFNRRLREAIQSFELDLQEHTVGYDGSLREPVTLLGWVDGGRAEGADPGHQARVEELRQFRRLLLGRSTAPPRP